MGDVIDQKKRLITKYANEDINVVFDNSNLYNLLEYRKLFCKRLLERDNPENHVEVLEYINSKIKFLLGLD